MASFRLSPSLAELVTFRGRLPCGCLRNIWNEGAKTHLAEPRWPSGIQPGEGGIGKQETAPAPSAASAGEMDYLISWVNLFLNTTRRTLNLRPLPVTAAVLSASVHSGALDQTLFQVLCKSMLIWSKWAVLNFTGSCLSGSPTYFVVCVWVLQFDGAHKQHMV